ncbi:membrane-bound ClpP family serine protease [Pullulanibacillus pueri]|uniref:Uncharacterized protein n=1 Tax=Pullulanibacillus pueri TaxID=1437324 RepID=A0A8J2ZZL5_9BACL|nr:hypothetical protein [Pullulanibacillus pueri]MBM7683824.1 membrane-bound ClpP family serine protease [Pullulanibacillus pueri]GGH87766.1 hypothetical protein GCM10007096_38540 [Pullulanibacillus pueri]
MHVFTTLYFLGLLIGIGYYVLTHLIFKEIKENKSILFLLGAGLVVLGLVVGGFGGMPISVLGIGILTIAVILIMTGKHFLWRKYIFTFIVLVIVGITSFVYINKPGYWIIKKENPYTTTQDNVYSYYKELQTNPDIKGFKVMNITEGRKAIVLSLGKERTGDSLEVTNLKEQYEKTTLTVRSFYNKSTEKNPTIIVGVDRLQPHIEIRDVDGTIYKKVK